MSALLKSGRRALLRGAGASILLPFLPSLARAAPAPPLRWLTFFFPNGIVPGTWDTEPGQLVLADSPALSPLARWAPELTLVRGLQNALVPQGDGDHNRGTAQFLTCVPVLRTQGDRLRNGISADQIVARAIGDRTRFRSLELGTARAHGATVCEFGWTCIYQDHISWDGPKSPRPKLTDPALAFERLFGTSNPSEAAAVLERRATRRSVLDAVRAQARLLERDLPGSERPLVDEYLTGIRELERRLPLSAPPPPEALPAGGDGPAERLQAMRRIAVLALQADQTRVLTLMHGYGIMDTLYGFLGLTEGHHTLSHHTGDAKKKEGHTTVVRWLAREFATLLDDLAAVREADGSRLLDHTLTYFSSELGDGNLHAHDELPVLLAGATGTFAHGQAVAAQGRPLADLYLSVFDAFGLPETTFGRDGRKPLDLPRRAPAAR